MGNFVSARDPFNELSFLYSEQALRLKKFHVSIIKKFEHLESLQYYLSLIPRTNGQLISLTLSHCAYQQFLELHSTKDNTFILPASLKKFKLCKISTHFSLDVIPRTVETIQLEIKRKDIQMKMNKISGVHNLAERKVKHLSIKSIVHLKIRLRKEKRRQEWNFKFI